MSELSRTPLHRWHVAHGARMVDFAGWTMPILYTSIVEEHVATRRHGGLFDISHMGRLWFSGDATRGFLDRLLTRRIVDLRPGGIRYSLVTNEQGGILDDVLLYRLQDAEDSFLLVVNASNRGKILAWLAAHRREGEQVAWHDRTLETAMIAVQGPRALETVRPLLADPAGVDRLKYYSSREFELDGTAVLVSRTGYTGEDGCEIIAPAEAAERIWLRLLAAGQPHGAQPVGLGARDTLRLEAGMPLYGHELSEDVNPLEADLGFAVQCAGREFPGSRVLQQLAAGGLPRKRVGLRLDGKRVPRDGFPVVAEERPVGTVTSGTFSPTLDQPIAMAYVEAGFCSEGTPLAVDIRGRREAARIVRLPFYKRST